MRLEAEGRLAIFADQFKSLILVPNMGRYRCFSRHYSFVISAAFFPDTSDSKKKLSFFAFIHFRLFLLKSVYFAFIAFIVGQILIVCF